MKIIVRVVLLATFITSIFSHDLNKHTSKENCNEVCITTYEPVCGTNGKTYSNECELHKESCLSKSKVKVVSKGECPGEEICPEECPQLYSPICGSDGNTYGNGCELLRKSCLEKLDLSIAHKGECNIEPCPMCTEDYIPVCGSDQVTYPNQCFLKSASCMSKKKITVAYEGVCKKEEELCPEFCTEQYDPVCGSDGETYSNVCGLLRESCRSKKQIFVVSKGECKKVDCNKDCTQEINLVCSSLGVTFQKECAMKNFGCFFGIDVTVVSEGKCPLGPSCSFQCAKELRPICGSDGISRSNPCLFRLDACESKEELYAVHEGSCEADNINDIAYPPPEVIEIEQGKVGKEKDCSIQCTDEYSPVCGSNSKTYSNKCELMVDSCRTRKQIEVVSEGECPAEEECIDICSDIYDPVCGSDGNNYSNMCTLKSIACKTKSKTTVAYKGNCRTEEDCPTSCIDIYSPVCGTNRNTYENLCSLKMEACSQNNQGLGDIGLAHEGPCFQWGTINQPSQITWSGFREFDSDNNGMISSTEFNLLMESASKDTTPEQVERLFSNMDNNGDGFIEEGELMSSNTEHTQFSKKITGEVPPMKQPKEKSSSLGVGIVISVLIVGVGIVAATMYAKKRAEENANRLEQSPSVPRLN